ncbi:hypothetical protein IEO21_02983 [Rhodonia placenta]|uniref:Uncharacterized protein n=1 Tax=Rhodonia placenta TaxID=104341 RepID=A0A8H7P6N4_9APHY|nr:hypothetical protein IEO21_02983 [Postia placenta]
MVRPFPNEIWLDIFHGLAKEGEYDALERCRVACKEFEPMARVAMLARATGGDNHRREQRRRAPTDSTFASRLAGRWPAVDELRIQNAVWRTQDLDLDAVLRDLAVFSILRLHLYDVTFPSILTFGRLASPWSAVRRLELGDVTFPSVTTFARLLSYAFVKHGFHLRSVPVHPGLPLHLADIDLGDGFPLHSDPCSIADFVDLLIATGASKNLRRITTCLFSSPRVTSVCDAALNRLLKHLQSLRHFSFNQFSFRHVFSGFQTICIAPYFDLSSNTCLERLDLTVDIDHEDISHPSLCAPVVAILSQITSTHISRIKVNFFPQYSLRLDAQLDVDLGKLMNELPQLDAIFSRPIFNNLTDVVVHIRTRDGPNERDHKVVRDLRLCLPTLGARGILGVFPSR